MQQLARESRKLSRIKNNGADLRRKKKEKSGKCPTFPRKLQENQYPAAAGFFFIFITLTFVAIFLLPFSL